MKTSRSYKRAIRRKKENKTTNNSLISLPQITTVLNLSKEDIEKALISMNIRISGVLYDCPTSQLKKYLDLKQYENQEFILNRSINQTPLDDNL
tara:strand:+ start:221 stop:502 length:282 start_codon:yes stop_codon:yes gene_type:complete